VRSVVMRVFVCLLLLICFLQSTDFVQCFMRPAASRTGVLVKGSRQAAVELSMKAPSHRIVAGVAAVAVSLGLGFPVEPSFAIAQQYKLPPIDRSDPNRCELSSSAMGQANAARDKLYDLRECDLKGQSGAGKDMSGMIGSNSDFSGVNFKEGQISKALAKSSKFIGADFSNAVVDRVVFDESDLSKAVFVNAVLSGTTFTDANLKDTDFTDAYLGPFDLKNLCLNPTLQGKNPTTGRDTAESAGCLQ